MRLSKPINLGIFLIGLALSTCMVMVIFKVVKHDLLQAIKSLKSSSEECDLQHGVLETAPSGNYKILKLSTLYRDLDDGNTHSYLLVDTKGRLFYMPGNGTGMKGCTFPHDSNPYMVYVDASYENCVWSFLPEKG